MHVHGRAVDSNDDVTTARENETRSVQASRSVQACVQASRERRRSEQTPGALSNSL